MSVDFSKPVLVVDDFKTIARIIHNLLRQVGFSDVDTAFDGHEAMAKMKARKYGLVISDWHMAPMDGVELIKKARADSDLKDTPFILISGDVAPTTLEMAKDAGAIAYVAKPFDAETLKSRIERALAA